MSGAVPANPRIQFPSSTGGLLPGGFVDVFTAGTTTRVTTWQDKALTTPNQNPIALDTAGSCSLWTDSTQTYDFVVKDANSVAQYTLHNIVAAGVAPTVPVFNVDTFSGNGSQTAFTLSATPTGINNTDVYVSGVYQKKSAYTLTGNTLNFVAAPASGTNNIEVNTYNVTDYGAVSANILAVNNRLYPGTYAVAPTTRPDGSAIQNGDRYINSSDTFEYIRIGGAWSNGANQTQAAQVSAAQAANYAAAAATGAKFYDTIALGNAGVADAATFGVKAGGADGLTRPSIYRRESAGVSTLLYAVLPASEYDVGRRKTISFDYALADADGNNIIQLTKGKSLDLQDKLAIDASGSVKTTGVQVMVGTTMKYRYAMGDADGNLAHSIDSTGQVRANISQAKGVSPLKTAGTYDYDVNFFPVYGQSLAVGQATPAISTVQKYDNLMFVDGMRPQYDHVGDADAVRYGSFVPAVEAQSGADATLAETPCTGAGDAVKYFMLAEDGLSYTAQNYQMLLSAPGFGATTIAGLSKGTSHYTRLTTQVTYGLANSSSANKTFGVQAVAWGQGESDYLGATTQAAYLTSMNQLVSDLNTDIKAITGQTKSIPLICYQVASHKVAGVATPNIALAQLQAVNANALVRIATPMYIFQYQDNNNFHVQAIESRWMGAYFGLCYKRVVIDGLDWKPLQPVSSTRSGAIACVKMNVPVGKLVLDTALVALNTNYGFELVDSGGSPLTISSVGLRGRDTVKVVAAAPIPAGAKLRYAWSGAGNVGCSVGPRGNLRDQQGEAFAGHDAVIFDPNGINKPMHNWCVIFEWSL